MLEIFEIIKTSKGDNLYEYILNNIKVYRLSYLKFLFNHISFIYLLFIIFMFEFYQTSIILAAICKFLDIATKLYFVNKIDYLEHIKPYLREIKLTLLIKSINPMIYILLFSFGIYSIAKYS